QRAAEILSDRRGARARAPAARRGRGANPDAAALVLQVARGRIPEVQPGSRVAGGRRALVFRARTVAVPAKSRSEAPLLAAARHRRVGRVHAAGLAARPAGNGYLGFVGE